MKFIIHQVKIWFKSSQKPRVLDFKPNMINVITGDSGTGKTNILAIIDYCLLSEKNNIVQQVINENAEWYSLKLTINGTVYFIARKKELLGQESSSICFIANDDEPAYPTPNRRINDVRNELNRIVGITNTTPFKKDDFKVSYRTNLIFNYLTERIISLDNMYFDFDFFSKSLYDNHKQDILKLGIGYDYSKIHIYEQRLKELAQRNKEYEKWERNEINYKNSLDELISRALKSGLIDNVGLFDDIESFPNILRNMADDYKKTAELERISVDLTPLKNELSSLKLELKNIKRIENEHVIAEQNIEKFQDVLSPIHIIEKQDNKIVRSFETQQLIEALKTSLVQLVSAKEKRVIKQIIPQSEKNKINQRIKEIEKILGASSPKEIRIKNRSGFAFVEAYEISRELTQLLKNRSAKANKGQHSKVDNYAQVSLDLTDKIMTEKTREYSLLNSFNISMQTFYDSLKSMGVYSDCEISFDIKDLVVRLKEIGASYHYEKIGSKSNDMFLHLCCYLGIHKVAFDMKNTQKIFPFLFIDQPSIPYYSGSTDINNDDKDKLLDAFKLLNDFIAHINEEFQQEFQIILIEHAPESYWKEAKLHNFHTVDIFTDGNKLIPIEIIENK